MAMAEPFHQPRRLGDGHTSDHEARPGQALHTQIGINGRPDSIQAAVLLAMLAICDDEVARRAQVGASYSAALRARGAGRDTEFGLLVPYIESHNTSVCAQYAVQVDGRDTVQPILRAEALPTAVLYPLPLNGQIPYQHDRGEDDTSVVDAAAARAVSLPMHPFLPAGELTAIADTVLSAAAGSRRGSHPE